MTYHDDLPVYNTLGEVRSHTRTILGNLLSNTVDVALFDIPTHENVGDNMIWEGEVQYLSQINKRIAYETDLFRHSDSTFSRLAPDAPILLHGGGNFGDVWPVFQEFRESIVQMYPNRKIVQLPQTVYFASEERAAQANRILSTHPDFTLLVRDRDSYRRALQSLPDVHVMLCPDMALGWEPPAGTKRVSGRGVLVLARGDKEAAGDLSRQLSPHLPRKYQTRDWRLTGRQKLMWLVTRVPGRLMKLSPRLRNNLLVFRVVRAANRFNRKQNLTAGLRMVGGRSVVFTNRLHAHVLAGLIGVSHGVTENSYGKIGPIFRDYTHVLSSGVFFDDASHMAASDLMHSQGQR